MQYSKDLTSPHKAMFLEARSYLLNRGLEETRKDRITTYSINKRGICHLRTMPHGIDFGFLRGIHFEDPEQRLTGKGKTLRVLSMTSLDEEVLEYFLAQAIDFN